MRDLTPALLDEFYNRTSGDPFLLLMTFSHASFASDIRLVQNSEDITSNGNLFSAFPCKIVLPVDDGETQREVTLELDNVGLDLISELRTVTDFIGVNLQMVLASNPDLIEIEVGELKIKNIQYNRKTISATLFQDDFLNSEIPSEKYTPQLYPGIF